MKTKKKYKTRNPVARELYEERAFRLKVHDDRKKSPKKKITVEEAYKEKEENDEEDVCNYCGRSSFTDWCPDC